MTVFLIGLGLVLLFLGMHPYITYPLSLRFLKPAARPSFAPATEGGTAPSVSICMSVYNEERVIVAKVERLLAMVAAYPGRADINIYVDGSQDATIDLLSAYADRVRLDISHDRRGKTAGLNRLTAGASGDLLVFTDANVQTATDGLVRLSRPFADPAVGCASARLVYANAGETVMSATGAAYWDREEQLKTLESGTLGVIGVDGAFFAVRRTLYEHAPDDLIDDLYVSLAVLLQGARVVSCPDVEVYERSAAKWREEFHRKARIACQAVNVHRALWPRLRRLPAGQLYGYLSHRVLRWASPFTLPMAAVLLFVGFGALSGWRAELLAGIIVATVLVIVLLAGVRRTKLAPMALVSFLGVATGVMESLVLARTYVTWTPAASVRA